MSFRTQIIAVVDNVYKIVLGPSPGLDLTPYQLSIITRTWPGRRGDTGAGAPVDSTLTLGQYFNCRLISAREVSASAGRYRDGDIAVEDITPPGDGGVGFTIPQLRPVASGPSQEVIYRLGGTVGGLSGDYALVEGRFDDWLSYTLVIGRRKNTP